MEAKPESAPNIFLMGEISTGKTRAIRTLIDSGVEVFLIPTEPGFADILGDIPPDKLHWHYIPSYGIEVKAGDTTTKTLSNLKATAQLLQNSDMEAIKKMPGQGRNQYNQFFQLLEACNNFTDDRTGISYGDTALLNPQQALVIDGLSGINNMVSRLVAGNKPCMSWPEFEATQFTIEQFINTLAQSLKCWFIVTSHVEREQDPVTLVNKIMPSTVGKVLAPRLTKFFSEAILCKRVLDNGKSIYVWDNITTEATVKNRNLPQAPNHKPDFGVIKANWEKKVEFTR